jgi:hypothetical protein
MTPIKNNAIVKHTFNPVCNEQRSLFKYILETKNWKEVLFDLDVNGRVTDKISMNEHSHIGSCSNLSILNGDIDQFDIISNRVFANDHSTFSDYCDDMNTIELRRAKYMKIQARAWDYYQQNPSPWQMFDPLTLKPRRGSLNNMRCDVFIGIQPKQLMAWREVALNDSLSQLGPDIRYINKIICDHWYDALVDDAVCKLMAILVG